MTSPPLLKRLGQHHLVRGDLCRPMLDYLEPSVAPVVEIGPGGGVLTRELLAADASILAFEVDPAWAFALRRRLPAEGAAGRLRVCVADAMRLEWRRLPPGRLVTGNLPYNIASRLTLRLLAEIGRFRRLAFLMQEEVARRFVARPGDADYGSLAVLAAIQARPVLLGRVSRADFRPRPRVDGAFVGLLPRAAPLAPAAFAAFAATVRLAFGRRRKTLANALAAGRSREDIETAVTALGLDPRVRAQELPPERLLELHLALSGVR